jgi:hypothetical protein
VTLNLPLPALNRLDLELSFSLSVMGDPNFL